MRHYVPALRPRKYAALLAAITLLGACASEEMGEGTARPIPIASQPEQLARRLPAQAGGFHRGTSSPIQQPAPGVEVSYGTPGRSAAGFVQVVAGSGAMPDGVSAATVQAEYQRWVGETSRGANAHRRLRVANETTQPAQSPMFRCAEMEGTYGRQPVQSVLCVGAAGGQLLRLRVSMPRRDPPVADPHAFIRDIAAALRAGS